MEDVLKNVGKNRTPCYCGYLKNEYILRNSSSGGCARALMELFIETGGYVIGCCWSNNYRSAFFYCTNKKNDLDKLVGTKYISPKYEVEFESKKENLFTFIEDMLSKNNTLLFIGPGCYVGAIHTYLKLHNTNITNYYTCDLLCHGPALDEVHAKFLDELELKYKSPISYLNHRFKLNAWTPVYIKVIFESGRTVLLPFIDSSFGKAFYRFAKPMCTSCHFKGSEHRGDLCIGDFWGADEKTKGYNKMGTSLILQQTKKGEQLISKMMSSNIFKIFSANYDFAIENNPMYIKSRHNDKEYDRFVKILKRTTLKKALRRVSFKKELLNVIKKPIKVLLKPFASKS